MENLSACQNHQQHANAKDFGTRLVYISLTWVDQPRVKVSWASGNETGSVNLSLPPNSLLTSKGKFPELLGEQFHAGTQAMVAEFGLLRSEAHSANSLWWLLKITWKVKTTKNAVVASNAVLTLLTRTFYEVGSEILLLVRSIVN